MSQTLEQKRALHAWNAIESAKKIEKKEDQKKFGGQAKKLPTRILASGLGQALAFLCAKKYAPLLVDSVSGWVTGQLGKEGDLLQLIIQEDSDFLRRATDEALAYLQWLVRFADAAGLTDNVE